MKVVVEVMVAPIVAIEGEEVVGVVNGLVWLLVLSPALVLKR